MGVGRSTKHGLVVSASLMAWFLCFERKLRHCGEAEELPLRKLFRNVFAHVMGSALPGLVGKNARNSSGPCVQHAAHQSPLSWWQPLPTIGLQMAYVSHKTVQMQKSSSIACLRSYERIDRLAGRFLQPVQVA